MHENLLAKEESPYLLQHAHNPVRQLLICRACACVLSFLTLLLMTAAGGLVPMGRGGIRSGKGEGLSNLPVNRLLNMSLVNSIILRPCLKGLASLM